MNTRFHETTQETEVHKDPNYNKICMDPGAVHKHRICLPRFFSDKNPALCDLTKYAKKQYQTFLFRAKRDVLPKLLLSMTKRHNAPEQGSDCVSFLLQRSLPDDTTIESYILVINSRSATNPIYKI